MTRTETGEEIRVIVPEGGYCRYCPAATAHQHVWTKPKRCPEILWVNYSAGLRCELDAGHDSGPFPRRAWNHGIAHIGRWITEPTPHRTSWVS